MKPAGPGTGPSPAAEAAEPRRGRHDRQDETLLAAIAVGLWANIAGDWLKPEPIHAQDTRTLRELETVGQSLRSIERELENGAISRGGAGDRQSDRQRCAVVAFLRGSRVTVTGPVTAGPRHLTPAPPPRRAALSGAPP